MAEEDTGMLKLRQCFWVCPFSTLSSLYPCSSLCACHDVEDSSVELILVSSCGPNHPNSFPCWVLLHTFLINLSSITNEASIRTVTGAGLFQKRRMCLSCAGVSIGKIQHSQDFCCMTLFVLVSVWRIRTDISQHWCWISTYFAPGSSYESPVGAVQ